MNQGPYTTDASEMRTGGMRLMFLLHAGFVLTGVVNTMLGPLLPVLSARWALSDERAGYLFAAQFCGSMMGVLGSGLLTPRRGHRASIMLGFGLMALGSATLLAMSWKMGMLAALCLGAGLGFAIPTTNLVVAELNSEKRAAALSLINFSWGVGAAASPFFAAALLRMQQSALMLYGIASLLILVAISSTRVSFPVAAPVSNHVSKVKPGAWRSRWVPIIGALFFLYVGSEAGTGGWMATYAKRMAAGTTIWIFTPSFFWSALLLGRAISPLLLRAMREATLAKAALGVSTIGLMVLLAARNLSIVAIAASLAGLGLSPVFPIAIATLSRKFGAGASRIAGVMFALAGAGGAILPWLIGYTSTASGKLKYGLFVPLFGCIAMLVLNVLLFRPDSDSEASP